MKNLDVTAQVLMVIGALNWGLLAISEELELIQYLPGNVLGRIVYGLVGLAGLYGLVKLFKK